MDKKITPGTIDKTRKLPTMLTLEDVYGKYEANNTAVGTDLEEIMGSMIGFLNNEVHKDYMGRTPSIAEEIFVKTWLPHFYHDTNINENGVSIAHAWVTHVSFSPYNMVDVIRDGTVIYRVPPLLSRIRAIGGKDKYMTSNSAKYQMESIVNRVPSAGVVQSRWLCDQMIDLKDKDTNNDSDLLITPSIKFLFVLDEIFTYYGYDTILNPEFMLIKPQVMGIADESNASRIVQSEPVTTGPQPMDYTDDDYLFG